MYCTVVLMAASMVVGQADANTTYNDLADLLVGGVWQLKEDDGTIVEHAYRRILDGQFLKNTASSMSGGAPGIAIVGIDPMTKQVTFWIFGQDGYVGTSTATAESKDVWHFKGRGKGSKGELRIEFRMTKEGADEIKVAIISNTLNGEEQDAKPEVWRRRK